MSRLRDTLSQTWLNIQGSLFPWLSEELGPLTEKQQELVTTLKEYRKRNASGAVYDDPRIAVAAGRFDEVVALAEA